MDEATRTARSRTFDTVAAGYDAVRPGYPSSLFEDIIQFAAISREPSVLEIGCGTGQATAPFAAFGAVMICLEPSPALSAFARLKFEACQQVNIITARFEDARLAGHSFDLIFAATAFHWVDPAVRFQKCVQLLKRGGTLAIFANIHPRPFTGFFAHVQSIYGELGPEWGNPQTSRTTNDLIVETIQGLQSEPGFAEAMTNSYRRSHDYTSQEYIRLLGTYSDHVRLGPTKLRTLQAKVRRLIDSEYGGRICRPYETLLCMARRI